MKKTIIKILDKLPYIKGLRKDINDYERWGVPGHFYNPIPNINEVDQYQDTLFKVPENDEELIGIDMNLEDQKTIINQFINYYCEVPFPIENNNKDLYHFENPNYSYGDAIFLYSIIRHFKPQNYIEIGSGYSSCAVLDVNNQFFQNKINCTFIEPYPDLLYDLIGSSKSQSFIVKESKIQDVDLNFFKTLKKNDILFVDSSHVVKTASDLQFIMFKIIPILEKGVLVHFHDIFYPFEYPKDWIKIEHRAWNEIYMLRAFLMYNKSFKIIAFNNYLINRIPEWFENNMPLCLKNPGGSIWLQKII